VVPFGCGLFACTLNLPNSTCDVLFCSKRPALQHQLREEGRASASEPSAPARPKTKDDSDDTDKAIPPSRGCVALRI